MPGTRRTTHHRASRNAPTSPLWSHNAHLPRLSTRLIHSYHYFIFISRAASALRHKQRPPLAMCNVPLAPKTKKQARSASASGSRAWTRQKQRWSVSCHVREGGCHIREGGGSTPRGRTRRGSVGSAGGALPNRKNLQCFVGPVPGHELIEEQAGTLPRGKPQAESAGGSPSRPRGLGQGRRGSQPGPLGGEAALGLGFSLQDLERIPQGVAGQASPAQHIQSVSRKRQGSSP